MDLKDRQATAAVLTFGVLVFGLPIVVLLGSLIATGWATILGSHDSHALIWGWLSSKSIDEHGKTVWGIGSVVWQYYLGVATAYVGYQFCELLHGGLKAFRGALA